MPLFISQTSSILFKTLPYIVLRMLVYSAFGLLFLLYGIVAYFIGQAFASLHENAPLIVWIIAILIPFPIVRLVREYFLYMLKAGHVAVIVHFAFKGDIPGGMNQIRWGKEQVMSRFKEASVLFVVDQLVNGVVASIHGMMSRIGWLFAGTPGMEGLIRLAKVVLRFSLTYVDESILARNFLRQDESIWESAKNGLILYAQSWERVLKTAFFLGMLSIVSYGVLFVLLLIPAFTLGQIYSPLQWLWILGALIFAAIIKLALFDPFALTNMILVYITETEGKVPDPAWEAKLEALSGKFREISQKTMAVQN